MTVLDPKVERLRQEYYEARDEAQEAQVRAQRAKMRYTRALRSEAPGMER